MSTPRPYQRVNTATDYATIDFDGNAISMYLRFDGNDDWMVTPTITPGIDKAQVFAGVRNNADIDGLIFETSSFSFLNTGACGLIQTSSSIGGYLTYLSGSLTGGYGVYNKATPSTDVLSAIFDISETLRTNESKLRVNASLVSQTYSNSDAGTGNFLAYPLYIGRRGGTTLPFNGHIHSLIVRFGSNLDTTTIEQTENWVNGKTLAY